MMSRRVKVMLSKDMETCYLLYVIGNLKFVALLSYRSADCSRPDNGIGVAFYFRNFSCVKKEKKYRQL